jgi:hypothetical protein
MRSSRLSSRATEAYQSLEPDEYEDLEGEGAELPNQYGNPPILKRNSTNSRVRPNERHDDPNSRRPSNSSFYGSNLLRTVSRDDSSSLSHPTPGLRSLQGAPSPNVERLEESAERLSVSSNIAEGIRRLQQQQKKEESVRSLKLATRQHSTKSQTNSIFEVNSVARSGGFSPSGYVASPSGSILSPWASHSVKSQKMEQSPRTAHHFDYISQGFSSPERRVLTVRNSTDEDRIEHDVQVTENDANLTQRPKSTDTFQEAIDEFANFDGVHIPDSPAIPPRHEQGDKSSLGSQEEPEHDHMVPYVPPHPESNMTFYPAPIPMMINLPPRLSKGPTAAEVAKRRTQLLHNEKSMQSINLEGSQEHLPDMDKRASRLPPQLRASLFFDQAPIPQEVNLVGGSATNTLDRILEASADAPVAAFTDHPIVGQVGADVYTTRDDMPTPARPKHTRTSTQMSNLRRASTSIFGFGSKAKPQEPNHDQETSDQGSEEAEEPEDIDDDVEEEEDLPLQRPSTLLAELQMRKAEQRQRNRTAATAFPDGMHSTLLQLDAVAQVQKRARQNKQVALAWEDPGADDDDPDDNVPLGMLFPNSRPTLVDRAGEFPEDRPLGLLAQRNLEDNEPLSRRRERLLGDGGQPGNKRGSKFALEVKGVTDVPLSDDEEETLAQRSRRLRGQESVSKMRPLSSEFAAEVLSQIGGLEPQADKFQPSKTPDQEETLGQRKRRLQAERQAREANPPKAGNATEITSTTDKRRSMGDLLISNPIGPRQSTISVVPGASAEGLINRANVRASTYQQNNSARPIQPRRSWTEQQRRSMQMPVQYQQAPTYQPFHTPTQQGMSGYDNRTFVQAGHQRYYHPAVYAPAVIPEPPLNPQQYAMIDNWRQNIP